MRLISKWSVVVPPAQRFTRMCRHKLGWGRNSSNCTRKMWCVSYTFLTLLDRILVRGRPQHWQGAQGRESPGRADRELTDDTLRVTSISFTYLDGPATLDQLLAKRGPTPYAWLLYSRLGDLYVQKERFQDEASAYRAFVAMDPANEQRQCCRMRPLKRIPGWFRGLGGRG